MARKLDIDYKESVRQNLNEWCFEVGTEYERYSREAAEKFIEYIGKQSVVDLGAGDGAATKVFLENGNKVIAVDINKEKLSKIDQRADIICQDIKEYMKFVVLKNVFLHHTLEHIVDYQEILDQIGKKLVKGGYCYIAVPKDDKPHSVHHVAFDSIEELCPPGLEVVEQYESNVPYWKQYVVIARKK